MLEHSRQPSPEAERLQPRAADALVCHHNLSGIVTDVAGISSKFHRSERVHRKSLQDPWEEACTPESGAKGTDKKPEPSISTIVVHNHIILIMSSH